jgi:hypothetical protein
LVSFQLTGAWLKAKGCRGSRTAHSNIDLFNVELGWSAGDKYDVGGDNTGLDQLDPRRGSVDEDLLPPFARQELNRLSSGVDLEPLWIGRRASPVPPNRHAFLRVEVQ